MGSGSILRALEIDLVAEGFELLDAAASDAVGVALERIVRAEILVLGAVLEEVVDDDEDGVADGDDGALLPAPGHELAVVRGEVGVTGARGGPGGFGEGTAQPGTALAGAGLPALAGTDVLAGADAGPGGSMAVGREAGHVGPELGQDNLGGPQADAGDRLQPRELLRE